MCGDGVYVKYFDGVEVAKGIEVGKEVKGKVGKIGIEGGFKISIGRE